MQILNRLFLKLSKFVNRPFNSGQRKGMTLIEIIIVIAIIGSLMTILIRNVTDQADGAYEDQTRIQLGNISQALQLYKVHNGKYPTTQQGINSLVADPGGTKRWRGPYIEKSKLVDAWGNDVEYQSDGRNYQLTSPGKDGELGTDLDIFYPEKTE
ncbi:MAG: type II secretion system protein GspG [Zetaproteobacteria bacterium]|nr:type II secretion system protein GspG [Pseudobdellovibrionaceae bacterium]